MILAFFARLPRWAWWVTGGIGLIAAIFATVHLIRTDAVEDDRAKTEARAAPARDAAAEARASDAIANTQAEREMHDAIIAAPTGTTLSAPAHALSCQRLRKLGRTPAGC